MIDPRLTADHQAAVDRYNRALTTGDDIEIRAAGDALLIPAAQRIIDGDRYIARTRGEP